MGRQQHARQALVQGNPHQDQAEVPGVQDRDIVCDCFKKSHIGEGIAAAGRDGQACTRRGYSRLAVARPTHSRRPRTICLLPLLSYLDL